MLEDGWKSSRLNEDNAANAKMLWWEYGEQAGVKDQNKSNVRLRHDIVRWNWILDMLSGYNIYFGLVGHSNKHGYFGSEMNHVGEFYKGMRGLKKGWRYRFHGICRLKKMN